MRSSGVNIYAMLAGPIAALKKMRTTFGTVLTVDPSTGSDPTTKACACATDAGEFVSIQA
jgi:hypothetical protein